MQIAPLHGWGQISSWSSRRWLGFWFFWSLLVSGVYWFLGPYSYIRIQDTTDFNLAYRIAAAKDFLEYGITYWQPKFAGGMPAWVMPLFDSFLITGPPFYLLPPWAAYGFIMWLQRFIAGYFTYKLCRSLGLNTVASLFAGMAFSLNNWSVIDWTLFDGLGPPVTPLYLYLFDRILRVQAKVRGLILVGLLGVFLALVASSALYTIFLLCGLPIWILYIRDFSFRDVWQYFFVFIFCAVVAELPGVIAILSFVEDSSRSLPWAYVVPSWPEIFSRYWLQLKLDVTKFITVYVCLALVGMALVRRWESVTKRLLLLLVATIVGSELLQLGQVLSGDILPPVKGNLRDFVQFTILFGVLVGASGLNLVINYIETHERVQPHIKKQVIVFVGLLAVINPIMALHDVTTKLVKRIYFDNYQANFASPAIKKFRAKTEGEEPFRVATMVSNMPGIGSESGMQFYPGYTFAYGFDSIDGYYRMYSMRSYQYWLLVVDDILAHHPIYKDFIAKRRYLFTPNNYAFRSTHKHLFFTPKETIPFAKWYNLDLLSLNNTRYIFSHWPLQHQNLKLLYKPVSEQRERDKWQNYDREERISQVLQKNSPPHALYIYENLSVIPRAFLVGDIEQHDDPETLLMSLNKKTVKQLQSRVLLQKGVLKQPDIYPTKLQQKDVSISYPRPDRVVINSQSDGAAILVLTDNYDRYWRVWVDGVEVKIFPAYHMFRGVELEKGKHEIVMEYWPPYRLSSGG
ncbi:MAG: YfhO family protein [Magnetococcales bacterium]|nr:YfhO family protein [Magnetococcales bacterium]